MLGAVYLATGPMSTDTDSPGPAADTLAGLSTEQARAGGAARPSSTLHGRLLRVSQLATIGEMAAGVAHELNQPLTAITAYAHACARMLGRPESDPAELQDALRAITLQAARAADIMRRLRGLARTPETARVPVHLNQLVRELLNLIEAEVRHQEVQLRMELAPELPAVLADGGQVQHVLLNFVRNSLEAMATLTRGTGLLTVRSSRTPKGDVELAVIDNGPGLDPATMQRVFDPFFSTKEQGTGLGLAMSHTIARAHGGSVGYRPNPPAGACFYLWLPPAAG